MTGKLTILNQRGDATLEWDRTDELSVERVRVEFDRLVKGERWTAYAYPQVQAGVAPAEATPEVIREFDPTAREIVVRPQLVGG
jgi:hypothetical protein